MIDIPKTLLVIDPKGADQNYLNKFKQSDDSGQEYYLSNLDHTVEHNTVFLQVLRERYTAHIIGFYVDIILP